MSTPKGMISTISWSGESLTLSCGLRQCTTSAGWPPLKTQRRPKSYSTPCENTSALIVPLPCLTPGRMVLFELLGWEVHVSGTITTSHAWFFSIFNLFGLLNAAAQRCVCSCLSGFTVWTWVLKACQLYTSICIKLSTRICFHVNISPTHDSKKYGKQWLKQTTGFKCSHLHCRTLQFFNNVFAFAVCAAWRQLLRPQLQCWLMMRFGPGVMHVGMHRSKKILLLFSVSSSSRGHQKRQIQYKLFLIHFPFHMNMLDSHQTIP